MATQRLQLIADNSTYANYYQWASAVSAWFAACGWLQATDTGQVMWSGMTLTTVSGVSGSNATYTYTGLTGLALAVGRTLTITGMTHSINNGTFTITGLGAGTFTIANQNGTPIAESGSTGAVTQGSTVPGSGAFFYEVWQPGDTLQTFYLKMEYGNAATSTNAPALRGTLSTTTNGAGTPTGYVAGPNVTVGVFTVWSSTIPLECNFSGDSGRICVMLFRNSPSANNAQQIIAIERSLNSSGAYYGTSSTGYVTLFTAGNNAGGRSQQSLVFGIGAAPFLYGASSTASGWAIRVGIQSTASTNTLVLNNSIPFDTPSPCVGFFDYSCTVVGMAAFADLIEGSTFTVTLYENTRTYIVGKTNVFGFSLNNQSGSFPCATCMRYD